MPRCVLVLELCTFTSHISLHSSLPASSELAIVQRCTEESKQEGCFAPVWGRGAERKERMKKWSRHLCQVHQSVISLPGFAKVKGNKKLNLAQLRQKPLKANETPDSQCLTEDRCLLDAEEREKIEVKRDITLHRNDMQSKHGATDGRTYNNTTDRKADDNWM